MRHGLYKLEPDNWVHNPGEQIEMSDLYKTVNGTKVRTCKYNCGIKVAWNDMKKFFIEVDHDNQHHTQERCKAFQETDIQNVNNAVKKIERENQRKQITLEMVQKKLESIGIIINVERLMKNNV